MSSEIAIRVEGLGKQYRLGKRQRYKALRDTVTDMMYAPFRAVRNIFQPTLNGNSTDENSIWALRNVSFEVKRGEVVGVIGRNGAGKSTLLKILSRIAEPTTGVVEIHGRVGSLLEVGTGFHPELTGRENVYFNGSILGMLKSEIDRKFGEIVAFAEVEKFIDTPVKHYSSGMQMRLAFSVAAHLDPEILLVDEVLAVGDAAFQKKSMGKIDEAARGGRTVIFVSHNMGAVAKLCDDAILLDSGQIKLRDVASNVVKAYLAESTNEIAFDPGSFRGELSSLIRFEKIRIENGEQSDTRVVSPLKPTTFTVSGMCEKEISGFRLTFSLFKEGMRLLSQHDVEVPTLLRHGYFESIFSIPAFFLRPGEYSISLGGYRETGEWIWGTDVLTFTVLEEWSPEYDPRNYGVVNLPGSGKRVCFDLARQSS